MKKLSDNIIHIQLGDGVLCNAHSKRKLLSKPITTLGALRSQLRFQMSRPHNPRLCRNCIAIFIARLKKQLERRRNVHVVGAKVTAPHGSR